MNYLEAEQFLLSLSNMPRKEYMEDPRQCGVYLKRVQCFLDTIGNPEKKIPHYIHVTGTSGKGSVCAYLESILRASGKKTGLYVSPHPTELTERWQVNGKHMSQQEFVAIVAELKPKLDKYLRTSPYDMLSFFDLTTAIALYYFAQTKVAWAVIEVGCGGRYDATNVIPHKDVAVITNVGLDHTEILGNTKEKIAYEKAGIITPGIRVWTTEKNKKVLRVIQKECGKNKAVLSIVTTSGSHQIKNAALAAGIAEELGIKKDAIQRGLKNAHQPLRFEIVSKNPLIILDGAHNEDKMKTTVASVAHLRNNTTTRLPARQVKQYSNIHLIVSFSNNKDISRMIHQLATLKPKSVACTRNTVNAFRKVAYPKIIAQKFRKLLPRARIEAFVDPTDALTWSKKQAKTEGIILATGSIFMSGELRRLFRIK